MTELVATTPGLLPLPDWAKGELSNLKGHQKSDLIDGTEGEAVTEAYDRVRAEELDWQTEAGLDRVVEGQARWDDNIAHPLSMTDAVDTRGIVRYYDNNNFYREPVVVGELTATGDVAAELDATAEALDDGAGDLQAVLPGPYSLADLATDEYYGDEAAFLDAIADFLVDEVERFPDVATLFLLEPSLVENPPEEGIDERAGAAIDRVATATDADVVCHTYWGAVPEKPYAHLMDADLDAVGFDFVSDHEANLYNITEYGTTDDIALGLVDGQNTRVEGVETVRGRVEWVGEQVPSQSFDTTYLTANTELFYLPVNRAREKLAVLARAAAGEEEVTA